MICPFPSCKTELKENITLKKGLFGLKKVYTSFCPLCDFRKSVIFKISKENYNAEVLQMSNTIKITKQIYDTSRKEEYIKSK